MSSSNETSKTTITYTSNPFQVLCGYVLPPNLESFANAMGFEADQLESKSGTLISWMFVFILRLLSLIPFVGSCLPYLMNPCFTTPVYAAGIVKKCEDMGVLEEDFPKSITECNLFIEKARIEEVTTFKSYDGKEWSDIEKKQIIDNIHILRDNKMGIKLIRYFGIGSTAACDSISPPFLYSIIESLPFHMSWYGASHAVCESTVRWLILAKVPFSEVIEVLGNWDKLWTNHCCKLFKEFRTSNIEADMSSSKLDAAAIAVYTDEARNMSTDSVKSMGQGLLDDNVITPISVSLRQFICDHLRISHKGFGQLGKYIYDHYTTGTLMQMSVAGASKSMGGAITSCIAVATVSTTVVVVVVASSAAAAADTAPVESTSSYSVLSYSYGYIQTLSLSGACTLALNCNAVSSCSTIGCSTPPSCTTYPCTVSMQCCSQAASTYDFCPAYYNGMSNIGCTVIS